MHQATSVSKDTEKKKRAKPGANVMASAGLRIAKALEKMKEAQDEISEAANGGAQASSQYAAHRDDQMRRFCDKIQTASAGKVYDHVMSSILLDDEGKKFVNECFNIGREKKLHRKFKPAESQPKGKVA